MSLPPYINRSTIHKRLLVIFPEGVPHRGYCVREAAASTVFTMLYVGAVEGRSEWVAPKQIVRMTDSQAALKNETERAEYAAKSLRPGFQPRGKTWYRENSREQIRDEILRQGFIPNNAVIERSAVPTTSAKPRYALRADFAALFDPTLSPQELEKAAEAWREKHLSASALARTVILRRGAATTGEGILITFPNGETRRVAPGPSSVITKAVVEEFAAKHLLAPAVLWISESGAKVVARDDELASKLNLKISADRNLPDIILVDMGVGKNGEVLLVFIEVVATDGPITHQRRNALLKIALDAGFPERHAAFVTAFLDRSHPAFKKAVADLAWDSFVWFAAEPQNLIVLRAGKETIVSNLAALI